MSELINTIKLYAGVLKRVGSTMTVGMLNANGRDKLQSLYNFYSPPSAGKETEFVDPFILPKTDIFELIGNDSATYEGVYECGYGHTTEFELKVISNLVKQKNPDRIFEIGTYQGRTTLNMAINANPACEIFTLDLPKAELDKTKMEIEVGEERYVDKDESGTRFKNHPMGYKIKQVYGDSATYDFSPYHNSIDIAFIDGSHAYGYVLNDSHKILPTMRKGGLIIWHDYTNWQGVWTALNELQTKDARFKNIKHIGGTSIAIMEV